MRTVHAKMIINLFTTILYIVAMFIKSNPFSNINTVHFHFTDTTTMVMMKR